MNLNKAVLAGLLMTTQACVQDYSLNGAKGDSTLLSSDESGNNPDTSMNGADSDMGGAIDTFVPTELTDVIKATVGACLQRGNPCPVNPGEYEFCTDAHTAWTGLGSNSEIANLEAGAKDATIFYREHPNVNASPWENGELETNSSIIVSLGANPQSVFGSILNDPYWNSTDVGDNFRTSDPDNEYFASTESIPAFIGCSFHQRGSEDFHLVDAYVYIPDVDGSNCDLASNVASSGKRGFCGDYERKSDGNYTSYYTSYNCNTWDCTPTESAIQTGGANLREALELLKVTDTDSDGTIEYILQ